MNARGYTSQRRQRGLAAVETAFVATVVLIVLFGVFEVGRVFFVANALEEAARRGARIAAVCQIGDPAIAEIAIFNTSGGGGVSPVVHGLTPANIEIDYMSNDGSVVNDTVGSYGAIETIRVTIQNYQHELIIPFFMRTFTMPAFTTTVPRESLGVTRDGLMNC